MVMWLDRLARSVLARNADLVIPDQTTATGIASGRLSSKLVAVGKFERNLIEESAAPSACRPKCRIELVPLARANEDRRGSEAAVTASHT